MAVFPMDFGGHHRHIGRHAKIKRGIKLEISSNLGPRKGPRKVIVLVVFGVRLQRCARAAPSGFLASRVSPNGDPQAHRTFKVSCKGAKNMPHSHSKATQINKMCLRVSPNSWLVGVATILSKCVQQLGCATLFL